MALYFLACVIYIILELLEARKPLVPDNCVYKLHLFDDGPTVLDVPVSISAFLECSEDEDYLFIFEDDLQQKTSVRSHRAATANFTFSDRPGPRTMTVSAYILYPTRAKVASKNTTIEVHEYLPGELVFSNIVTNREGQRFAAVDRRVNITMALYTPRVLHQDAEISYSWTIGNMRFASGQPFMVHRFTEPGTQVVRAAVVARVPSYDGRNITRFKWGYFDSEITIKNPFKTFNISGNTYLRHGELLNLDISCSGSGPVDYCWKVLPPSKNKTNLSCTDPVTVVECSFPVIYYFQESGDHLLAIYVDNLISRRQRNIEIHIYDVSLRPQLSTVIIPVVCTVLVLLIIVSAVVIHVRRNRSYGIETADFDFMVTEESRTVNVETSWEYMQRTFLQLLRFPYIYYSTQVQLTNYGTVVCER